MCVTENFHLLFDHAEMIADAVVEEFELGVGEEIENNSNDIESINDEDGGRRAEETAESEKGMDDLKKALSDKFGLPISNEQVSVYVFFKCISVFKIL